MKSGIYAILNLITEKYYIGSAKNLYKRWHIHKSMLKGNYHDNSYLQKAWNKYGEINFLFVVLEYTECWLLEKEQIWIDKLCYNKFVSYNLRKIANSNIGIPCSEEKKIKLSLIHKGRKHSEETKLKMSRSSGNRNKEKWPHKNGAKCKCLECKEKHKLRDKMHMKEYRALNREHYNKYMREYRIRY